MTANVAIVFSMAIFVYRAIRFMVLSLSGSNDIALRI